MGRRLYHCTSFCVVDGASLLNAKLGVFVFRGWIVSPLLQSAAFNLGFVSLQTES